MRAVRRHGAAALLAGVAAFLAIGPAPAQMPPTNETGTCVCLKQAVDALGADWTAKQSSYDTMRSELARLDDQLQRARGTVDVNHPEAVAQFRQLLDLRDAAYRRSTDMATGELATAIARYNARVNEYNARCASRPLDLGSVAPAALRCPPPY